MTIRKLASIRRIAEIVPIEGADAIEAVRVGGWWVVTKKDEFKVDDLCVYFELDSWVPTELAPFLSKGREPREYEGIRGERLRTVKLMKTTSQGLVLPLSQLFLIVENEGKRFLELPDSHSEDSETNDEHLPD